MSEDIRPDAITAYAAGHARSLYTGGSTDRAWAHRAYRGTMFRAEHFGSTAARAVHADIAAPDLPPTPPAARRRLLGTPALAGLSHISNRGGSSWEDANQAHVLKAVRALARA